MIGWILASLALVFAALPAFVFLRNLRWYTTPALHLAAGLPAVCAAKYPPASRRLNEEPSVSLLIPARNEEGAIAAAVEAALASQGIDLEVIVLDDHSEDRTAEIVRAIAARDGRVRLESAPPLPAGWCGKQHACWVLAQLATKPLLLFQDADVRLAPDGVARLVACLHELDTDLLSGVPCQETGTFLEVLLIPLIHWVLLGFLPMDRMRASRHPAYAAGCGQLFLARRESYAKMGGHAVIRSSLHDGITLPRAFRSAGLHTDLCDATEVARCRMYRSAAEVWNGLTRNATEGLARPVLLPIVTLLFLFGQVLPLVLLATAGLWDWPVIVLAGLATLLLYLPRWIGISRFRQPVLGAVLHPVGVVLLLVMQWYALGRATLGRPSAWKGRRYQPVHEPGGHANPAP